MEKTYRKKLEHCETSLKRLQVYNEMLTIENQKLREENQLLNSENLFRVVELCVMRAKFLNSTNAIINESIPKEVYAGFMFNKTIIWLLNDEILFKTSLIERFSCDGKKLTVWTNNSMYQFELEFDFIVEFNENTRSHQLRLDVDKIEAIDIVQKYPQIYGDTFSCFECGKEWFPVILDLSEKIQKQLNENPDWKIQVLQIKEKFGKLCFYADCNDEIQSTINEACQIKRS